MLADPAHIAMPNANMQKVTAMQPAARTVHGIFGNSTRVFIVPLRFVRNGPSTHHPRSHFDFALPCLRKMYARVVAALSGWKDTR